MYKSMLERKIYYAFQVFYVRPSHDMCARAHVHSLEGTLIIRIYYKDIL